MFARYRSANCSSTRQGANAYPLTLGERMKRWLIALLVTSVVFTLAWRASAYVNRALGPHTWGNAYMTLRMMERRMTSYKKQYGRLPEANRVNVQIEKIWKGDPSYIVDSEDEEALALSTVTEVSAYDRLRVWDRPPRFVVTEASPAGFGFYLEGEDGMSKTEGSDPDDINSWSSESMAFYYDRLRRGRNLRDATIAAIVAAPVLIFMLKLRSRSDKNNDAQQGEASDAV